MFDLDKVKEDGSCLDIANYYGWPMRHRGKHTFCKCPKHRQLKGIEDTKIDMCVIKQKSFFCYSCGASGGVVDFTMAILEDMNGIAPSLPEAVKDIVFLLGDSDYYTLSEMAEKERKEFPLDNEQLTALGLRKTISINVPVKTSYDKMSLKTENYIPKYEEKEDAYLGYHYSCSESLVRLFSDEPDTFEWLIKNKASEMAEKYRIMLEDNCLWKLFEKLPIPTESIALFRQMIKVRKGICERLLTAQLMAS